MKRSIFYSGVLLAGLLFCYCNSTTRNLSDYEVEKKEVLQWLEFNKQLLLTGDPSFLRKMYACSDSAFAIVDGGKIIVEKVNENYTDDEIIDKYNLKSVKYTNIDNLDDPIIRISPDGKMAFAILRLKLSREVIDTLENKFSDEFTLAYLTVLQKHDDCWSEAAFATTYGEVESN